MVEKKINHWCIVCGKGYHACDSCDETKFMTWRRLTDSSNHYEIRLVIDDYTSNVINKKQARKMLNKCDIDDYKTFLPHIVKIIDEILDDTDEVKRFLKKKKLKKKLLKLRIKTTNRSYLKKNLGDTLFVQFNVSPIFCVNKFYRIKGIKGNK